MSTILRWLQNFYDGTWGRSASASPDVLSEIDEQLQFAKSNPLTLGVEFELALLDRETLQPKPCGPEIIELANNPNVKKEMFKHMVEVTTGICSNANDAGVELEAALRDLITRADAQGAVAIGSGRPPTLKVNDAERVKDERYDWLKEQRQVLYDRFGTLGMHIHIGMPDENACVQYHNFFTHFIPHFIALSAASPFEEGVMTGLASARALITETLPVGGIPYHYKSWPEYTTLVRAMAKAGSIRSLKDIWCDIRPAPRFGTLELRMCDQPSNLQEAMAIVAFAHLLAKWFSQHQDWLNEMPRPDSWRLRENKWRAIRYGIEAEFITNMQGEVRPLLEDINMWLDRVSPLVEEMGYQEHVANLRSMLIKGNSAQRQKRLHAAGWSNEEISAYLARTLNSMKPMYDEVDAAEVNAAQTPAVPLIPPSAIAACLSAVVLMGQFTI